MKIPVRAAALVAVLLLLSLVLVRRGMEFGDGEAAIKNVARLRTGMTTLDALRTLQPERVGAASGYRIRGDAVGENLYETVHALTPDHHVALQYAAPANTLVRWELRSGRADREDVVFERYVVIGGTKIPY